MLLALLILSIIWYWAKLDSEGIRYNRCLLYRYWARLDSEGIGYNRCLLHRYWARLDSERLGYNRCLLHHKFLLLVFLILRITFRSAGRSCVWVCPPISVTRLELRNCGLTCRRLHDFALFVFEINTMFYSRKPYSVSCIYFFSHWTQKHNWNLPIILSFFVQNNFDWFFSHKKFLTQSIIIPIHLWVRSQNCETRLSVSTCPFVRMGQLGHHWTDVHISYLTTRIFRKCRQNSSFIKIGQDS